LLVSLAVLVAHVVGAQETVGGLEGRVVDAGGQPIVLVNVAVTGPSLQGSRNAVSKRDGRFAVLALPAGIYSLRITHVSYQPVLYDAVVVQLGVTTSVGDVQLTERTLQLPQVVVRATRPLISPTTTTVGTNLRADDFRGLPIGRDYLAMTALLPHSNESFLGDNVNVAGGTGFENRYYVEGIDVTDPFQASAGISLPYNFVKEVQAKTGSYEPEYASSLGGLVNVITYSGGNTVKGEVFGFFVNNQFAGDARTGAYELPRGDFARYDFGVGVGGPIMRDRLWYFASYSPAFVSEDVEIPGLGSFDDHSTRHGFAGKLSWRMNEANDLVLTVIGDPMTRRGVGDTFANWGIPAILTEPTPYLTDIEGGGVSASLIGQHRISDALQLESSVYQTSRTTQNMGSMDPLFIDTRTGAWSGGPGTWVDADSRVTTAGVTATLAAGHHTVKGGLEYKSNRLDGVFGWAGVQMFSDTSFLYIPMLAQGEVGNRIPSAFLQDSWQLGDHWRINGGVRWDGQYFVDSNGDIAQSITDQWQPRIGVVYQSDRGKQRIAGSWGRFYEELSTLPILSYYSDKGTYAEILCDHDPREGTDGCDITTGLGAIQPRIDMQGQYYDEVTAGYERLVMPDGKVGLRALHRRLGASIEDGEDPLTGQFWLGNAGRGPLAEFPDAMREYSALEVSLQYAPLGRASLVASYVLSRSYGNYGGLYNADYSHDFVNCTGALDKAENMRNATGLLPNDRTHVFKLFGLYPAGHGLTAGASLIWESGTPLSEFGAVVSGGFAGGHLRKRGTAGRTPSIWDLNLRFQYEFSGQALRIGNSLTPRMTVDLLHVASQRKPVNYDQQHYYEMAEDGTPINPNPFYGQPTRYQPPMAVRLGLELGF